MVCGTELISSRQHFLRFQLPETYNNLVNVGFKEEFSMGFAEHVGFRSGTARSHKWFDLLVNRTTNFTIRPFAYMDGTLREYMKLDQQKSKEKIQQLFDEVINGWSGFD